MCSSDLLLHAFFAGCDMESIKTIFSSYIPANPKQNTTDPTPVPVQEIPKIQPNPSENPPNNNEWIIYFENSRTAQNDLGRVVDLDVYEVTNPSTESIDITQWTTNTIYTCGPASADTYSYLNKGKKQELDT